jgi:hypothetical protein
MLALDLEDAISTISGGMKFLYLQRQMSAIQNPASKMNVRLTVEGGPSLEVQTKKPVSAAVRVAQPCTFQVMRVNPNGSVTLIGKATTAKPGTKYTFNFDSGFAQGKGLLKVIATKNAADLSGIVATTDLSGFVKKAVGPAGDWAEDQDTFYVGGDWRTGQS